jgi:hypothetical protein
MNKIKPNYKPKFAGEKAEVISWHTRTVSCRDYSLPSNENEINHYSKKHWFVAKINDDSLEWFEVMRES